MRASTLLGSWARIPELVSEQDIVNLIKNGSVAPLIPAVSASGSTAAPVNVSDSESDSDVEVVAGPGPSSSSHPHARPGARASKA